MGLLADIESKVIDFRARGGELQAMQREAIALRNLARTQGDSYREQQAVQAWEGAREGFAKWRDTMERLRKLERIVNAMPGVDWQPLGFVPLVLPAVIAVSASAALIGMTLVINRTIQMRSLLDGIKSGWLSPDEAERIAKASKPFGGLLSGIGLGGMATAAVVGYLALRKS